MDELQGHQICYMQGSSTCVFIYYRLTHHDPNDAVSTDHLLRSVLTEEVVFYQQKSSNNDQPLVIVLQSAQQLEDFKKFGANVVFVDASYSGIFTLAAFLEQSIFTYTNKFICSVIPKERTFPVNSE